MWETLTDHLEVLWGAALALAIVILLTPAVGGMARMLGVVDRPGARRLNRRAVPRLGGLALFFGIFVPALAFLPFGRETKGLLLGAAVATLVGAIQLGFTLGALAIQGLLKTAAVATLLFPLLVLAVPIIDTSFVVAKRLKYRQPVYVADRYHLHHRFMNIGFSQPRAALYMWGWCAILAGAALATRFIHPHAHGVWHPWQTVAVGAIGLLALAASIYMVYLLEIVKLANPRIRRREQEAREAAARRPA